MVWMIIVIVQFHFCCASGQQQCCCFGIDGCCQLVGGVTRVGGCVDDEAGSCLVHQEIQQVLIAIADCIVEDCVTASVFLKTKRKTIGKKNKISHYPKALV